MSLCRIACNVQTTALCIVDAFGLDGRLPESKAEGAELATEWVLLTSGTTGRPKLVVHTLASLTGAIGNNRAQPRTRVVWSTFYDIRRYGGLQIFLRAVMTGTSWCYRARRNLPADFLARAAADGVTHISGTPSHWRRALMSPAAHLIDTGIRSSIRRNRRPGNPEPFARLRIRKRESAMHSPPRRLGVAFDVNDGLAGFPASGARTARRMSK